MADASATTPFLPIMSYCCTCAGKLVSLRPYGEKLFARLPCVCTWCCTWLPGKWNWFLELFWLRRFEAACVAGWPVVFECSEATLLCTMGISLLCWICEPAIWRAYMDGPSGPALSAAVALCSRMVVELMDSLGRRLFTGE